MSHILQAKDPDCMLSERDLAARWGLSSRTLQRWRSEGFGPPFINIGGSIRYQMGDIIDFEARHRHGSDAT